MSRIALIACCKNKDWSSGFQEAQTLYTGQLFRAQLAYARQRLPAESIYILSAKYGFVGLEQIVHPYEQTLNQMSLAERGQWANRVVRALKAHIPDVSEVWLMAGQSYRVPLVKLLEHSGIRVLRPHPPRLGYGQQVQWYQRAGGIDETE